MYLVPPLIERLVCHLNGISSCVFIYLLFLFVFVFQVCHSKSGDINPQKIATLVEAYVNKYGKKMKKSDGS
jgi:F0F1-type ATP synthase membrane subunit a